LRPSRPGSTTLDSCRVFLADWSDLIGVSDVRTELPVRRIQRDPEHQISFVQLHQASPEGLPVFDAALTVAVRDDGTVAEMFGSLAPSVFLGAPRLSEQAALGLALADARGSPRLPATAELGVFQTQDGERSVASAQLVWRTEVATDRPAIWRSYYDAMDGTLLQTHDQIRRDEAFETYHMGHGTSLPGTLWYSGQVCQSCFYYFAFGSTMPEVHFGGFDFLDFLFIVLGRDGWDHNQVPGRHALRLGSDYDAVNSRNAYWNPQSTTDYQAVFGDLASCRDVVAHEGYHGVTQTESNINTSVNCAPINESMSDAMGEYVNQWARANLDWVAGTGGTCSGYRDLADPEMPSCATCLRQPAHFSNFGSRAIAEENVPPADRLSSHFNAGIGNKLGWLLGRSPADGPATFAGITVTGVSNTVAARIIHFANTNIMVPSTTYSTYGSALGSAASYLYGSGSWVATQTANAVKAVGIWAGSVPQVFATDRRMTLVPVPYSGRTYVFYKEPAQTYPRLMTRYRTCNTCPWMGPTAINWAGKGPGAVMTPAGPLKTPNTVWVFAKYDLDDTIHITCIAPSGSYYSPSPAVVPTATTGDDASAVYFNDSIYLFYRQAGSGVQPIVYQKLTSQFAGWGPVQQTGTSSRYGPAVVAGPDGELWLFWVLEYGRPYVYHKHMAANGTWGVAAVVPNQDLLVNTIQGTPSAVVVGDRIHLALAAQDDRGYYTSFCPEHYACTYRPWRWTALNPVGYASALTLGVSLGSSTVTQYWYDGATGGVLARSKESE